MQIRLDNDGDHTVGEWEQFLAIARRAGGTTDTVVERQMYEMDDSVLIGWTVDAEPAAATEVPENASIPSALLHDLLFVARQVAFSDGDVRGLEATARNTLNEIADHFMAPAIGSNPRLEDERKINDLQAG